MAILAIDPGGTTGFAEYLEHNNQFFTYEQGPDEHHEFIENTLWYWSQHQSDAIVVCESFEYRQNQPTGLNLVPCEYIGIVKLYRKKLKVKMQTAAAAKSFVKDDNIKRLGLWVPGKPHAMDALRHLLFYMCAQEKNVDFLERGWKS